MYYASRPSTAGAPQLFQPPHLPLAEPFRTSQAFAVVKVVLGLVNLVFAIVALCLIILFAFGERDMEREAEWFGVTLVKWPWINNIYLSLAIATITWHLAEHITLGIRRGWRSICPAAHVGMHLILWALAVFVVTVFSIELAYELQEYPQYHDRYQVYKKCYSEADCEGTADSYFGKMEALTAFSVVMLILHFTLLVMACVETDRKRVHEQKIKIIYLVAAPGPADGRMYYTPSAETRQGHRGSHPLPPLPHHRQ